MDGRGGGEKEAHKGMDYRWRQGLMGGGWMIEIVGVIEEAADR